MRSTGFLLVDVEPNENQFVERTQKRKKPDKHFLPSFLPIFFSKISTDIKELLT
jgi:hypothetical protein